MIKQIEAVPRPLRPAGSAALAVVLLLCAVAPWARGGAHMPQAAYLALGACGAGLLLSVGWLTRAGSSPSPACSSLALPLFASAAWAGVSALFSVYRYATLVATCGLFAWTFLVLASCWGCSWARWRASAAWVLAVVGAFYSAYGLLQLSGVLPSGFWASRGLLASRFVNNNHFATFAGMAALVSAGLAVSCGRRWAGLAAASCGVLASVALVLSRSRGGWLAFAVGAGVFVALSFRSGGRLSRGGKAILAGCLAAAVAGSILVGRTAMRGELDRLRSQGLYSAVQRLDIWKGALAMAASRPWGFGAGSFRWAYPAYRTHSDRFIVTHAHNEYLQVASELGLVGLGLLGWVVVSFVSAARSAMSPGRSDSDYMLRVGAVAAVSAAASHALVDFSPHIAGVSVALAVCVGVACGGAGGGLAASRRRVRVLGAFVLGAAVAVGAVIGRLWAADEAFRAGEALRSALMWNDAVSEYERAARLVPYNTTYHERLGTIFAARALLAGRSDWREKATAAFRRAVEVCPVNANAHFQLATLYEAAGRSADADLEFALALRYDKANGRYRFRYAEFLLKEGRREEAARLAREALRMWPTRGDRRVIASLYDLGLGGGLDELVPDDAFSRLQLGSVMLARGDVDGAAGQFEKAVSLDGDRRIRLAVAREWGKAGRWDREAAALEDLLGIYPGDGQAKRMLKEARRMIEAGRGSR